MFLSWDFPFVAMSISFPVYSCQFVAWNIHTVFFSKFCFLFLSLLILPQLKLAVIISLFCHSSYSLRVLVLMHPYYIQCWWVQVLHLFLTYTIYLYHLSPGIKSSIFSYFGLFVLILPFSILRIARFFWGTFFISFPSYSRTCRFIFLQASLYILDLLIPFLLLILFSHFLLIAWHSFQCKISFLYSGRIISLFLSRSHFFCNCNWTAICLLSRKLFKLDERDMQDTAGEAGTNS